MLKLQLGFAGEGNAAHSTTQPRAYDLVAEGFGPGANGPMLIAVDMHGEVGVVPSLSAAINADPGVAGTEPALVDEASDVATIVAYPTTGPQDDATVKTISRLRSQVLPSALESSEATAHIGGQTATFSDVAARVSDRLPYFIVAVIVLSFLLLVVLFRSILVPLKAAVLNLLSFGAAFDTGDNDSSVIHGIASTARVITSAALIMISVFGAFVLAEDPTMKMFGLGLATAILIDATIVRIVLVPATMKLMGDANWWFPQRLDRFLPIVDLEGAPVATSIEEPVEAEAV